MAHHLRSSGFVGVLVTAQANREGRRWFAAWSTGTTIALGFALAYWIRAELAGNGVADAQVVIFFLILGVSGVLARMAGVSPKTL